MTKSSDREICIALYDLQHYKGAYHSMSSDKDLSRGGWKYCPLEDRGECFELLEKHPIELNTYTCDLTGNTIWWGYYEDTKGNCHELPDSTDLKRFICLGVLAKLGYFDK